MVDPKPELKALVKKDTMSQTKATQTNANPAKKTPTLLDFSDVGGLDYAIRELLKFTYIPANHADFFDKTGQERPNGVLIHGPAGTGKTLLAEAVEKNFIKNGNEVVYVNGNDIFHPVYGVTEKNLSMIFSKASERPNSVIIIDNIDALMHNESASKYLGELMENSRKRYNGAMLIGIARNIDDVSADLKTAGRFEHAIEIRAPDKKARMKILNILLKDINVDPKLNINKIAEMTESYTGRDLKELVNTALFMAIESQLNKSISKSRNSDTYKINDTIIDNDKSLHAVSNEHMLLALEKVKPSVMNDLAVAVPKVKWSSVGGLETVKEELKEAVELPLKNPNAFKRFGIRPIKGVILYGPPGTGKTLLAKAVATETHANFMYVKATELFNKWVGESEARTRKIFKDARAAAPSIIFIDEIDAIGKVRTGNTSDAGVRENVLNTFLMELDGIEELKNVVVIGATNRPDLLDNALLRPGRFDRIIEIPMPDEASRLSIFKVHALHMPLDKNVDLNELARRTERYSGSEIENVCREAGMNALRNKRNSVCDEDFKYALGKIKPLTSEDINEYKFLKRDEKRPIGFRPPSKQPT